MAGTSIITSSANDRLKIVRRLARRRDPAVFLAEGHRQLRCALAAGVVPRELYVAPELFLGSLDGDLVARAERLGARVVELSRDAYRSVCSNGRPDGLLAVVERWPTTLATVPLVAEPLLLVADGVERPGNLGTMIRSACSSAATALLSCDGRSDPFHPDTVRGSVGTLFHLPVAACASAEALAWLRGRGVPVVVATPEAELPVWRADLTGPLALVVGSERHGVSDTWRRAADLAVTIPMPGPVDSVNVAVAAGIVLFEAMRQRTRSPTLWND